jgi:hypothetical protein
MTIKLNENCYLVNNSKNINAAPGSVEYLKSLGTQSVKTKIVYEKNHKELIKIAKAEFKKLKNSNNNKLRNEFIEAIVSSKNLKMNIKVNTNGELFKLY